MRQMEYDEIEDAEYTARRQYLPHFDRFDNWEINETDKNMATRVVNVFEKYGFRIYGCVY